MSIRTSASNRGTVCIVAPMPPPYGGMSLQAERLVSRLRDEGMPVSVIATNPSFPKVLAWAHSVPALRTLIREVRYLSALLRGVNDYDVFHHFGASGLYFFAHSVPLLALGRLHRKKVILNYRGGLAAEFLKRWGWCAIPFMRLAAQICVPSEFLQQVFANHGLEANLLPNFSQTEMFRWKKRTRFAPSLLVTRHLEPMYNTECLLRAFRIIREKFAEATLTVAGDGSESARLQVMVREWKLSGVTFLGAVAHRGLPALYASHDIYVNSSNVDNFPGALVEAACSGLAIVTTGAGGIPWMIRDRESGIVVKLNDEKALAAGVVEIVENSQFASRLVENARSWAERFAWKNVFPRLRASYGMHVPAMETEFVESEAVNH